MKGRETQYGYYAKISKVKASIQKFEPGYIYVHGLRNSYRVKSGDGWAGGGGGGWEIWALGEVCPYKMALF